MPCGASELIDRLVVPFDAEPFQSIENGLDGRIGRAFAIGILNPQQHLAAALARIEPVEQRGARAADVEEAGRGRREAGNDSFGHFRRFDLGKGYRRGVYHNKGTLSQHELTGT